MMHSPVGQSRRKEAALSFYFGALLAPSRRLVHFSWGGRAGPQSFKIRDYIGGRLLQHRGAPPQPEDGFQIGECPMSRDEVWEAAQNHIPAQGELFHTVKDLPWWHKKLTEMTKRNLTAFSVFPGATARRRPEKVTEMAAAPRGERSEDLPQHSKRFRALRDKIKTPGPVPLAEAVKILKSFNTTKFNQTVEVSTHLGIDPRQSDQNVRGSVALPHGIGKSVRVAVFAQGDNAEKRGPRAPISWGPTTWRSRSRAARWISTWPWPHPT